ncbi:MAG: TlpA family protein disulfide reductase [Firmicutes bacterium]|nr:TlpA family protein disulfide reductase [Bacillota bacterium]
MALLLYTARGSGAQGVGVQVGARAPGFSLSALPGGRVSLQTFRGHPVLLDFFTSWCQACRDEAPSLEALYRQARGQVAVVGIDMTISEPDIGAVDLFAQTYGITFPILLDRTGQVSDTYQVQTIPTVMFLDRDGVIRGTASGDLSYSQLASGILPYVPVNP